METVKQCVDLSADRRIGEFWERQFCHLAAKFSLAFTPMQIGRSASAQAFMLSKGHWMNRTLPDVTVWTAPGEHHEIKHKNPTKARSFGLEEYRFKALVWFAEETKQRVFYTIHNHDLSGGKHSTTNDIDHWVTISVGSLEMLLNDGVAKTWPGTSWCGGKKQEGVPIIYWPADAWTPLRDLWDPQPLF